MYDLKICGGTIVDGTGSEPYVGDVAIRDGRTSTETVRRAGSTDTEQTHDEFVVMDAAGRIQIPREFLEQLGMSDRVHVEMEDGRIVVRPVERRLPGFSGAPAAGS